MTTVLLVRHAATDEIGKSLSGWKPGIHLNERGRAQASRLARRFRGSRLPVWSSPLERAVETAEAVSRETGTRIVTKDVLGELHLGEWTGQTFDALNNDPRWARYNRLRGLVGAPGGESLSDVQARIRVFFDTAQRDVPNGTVIAVTHSDVIRAALALVTGAPIDLLLRWTIDLASVTAIGFDDSGPRVLLVNHSGELDYFWAKP